MAPAVASAQGEHARRAASELLVIAGDAKRLADPDTNALHRKGLGDRIRGGLAGLDLLLRLSDQERGRPSRSYRADVHEFRKALADGDLTRFGALTEPLIAAHTFKATGILPATTTPQRLKRAETLHDDLCAGCHDDPDLGVERPAYNLFREVRRLPPLEFAARMMIGVRGDATTGIDNPLTDEQVASLIAYYRSREASPD